MAAVARNLPVSLLYIRDTVLRITSSALERIESPRTINWSSGGFLTSPVQRVRLLLDTYRNNCAELCSLKLSASAAKLCALESSLSDLEESTSSNSRNSSSSTRSLDGRRCPRTSLGDLESAELQCSDQPHTSSVRSPHSPPYKSR